VRSKEFEPFVSNDLLVALDNPIKFHPPHGGRLAFGYSATILADICEAVLATRNAGKLQKQHEPIADRCEILVRGFARVGIIALVDEVTGYQRDLPPSREMLCRHAGWEGANTPKSGVPWPQGNEK
jgi:hypothetical protein